jgi:hypothetical protein
MHPLASPPHKKSTTIKSSLCGTGILPVPKGNLLFISQGQIPLTNFLFQPQHIPPSIGAVNPSLAAIRNHNPPTFNNHLAANFIRFRESQTSIRPTLPARFSDFQLVSSNPSRARQLLANCGCNVCGQLVRGILARTLSQIARFGN